MSNTDKHVLMYLIFFFFLFDAEKSAKLAASFLMEENVTSPHLIGHNFSKFVLALPHIECQNHEGIFLYIRHFWGIQINFSFQIIDATLSLSAKQ